jgi:hypothetical protein
MTAFCMPLQHRPFPPLLITSRQRAARIASQPPPSPTGRPRPTELQLRSTFKNAFHLIHTIDSKTPPASFAMEMHTYTRMHFQRQDQPVLPFRSKQGRMFARKG